MDTDHTTKRRTEIDRHAPHVHDRLSLSVGRSAKRGTYFQLIADGRAIYHAVVIVAVIAFVVVLVRWL
jgi:hypothetical protein